MPFQPMIILCSLAVITLVSALLWQRKRVSSSQTKTWRAGEVYRGQGELLAFYRRYGLHEPLKGHKWVRDKQRYLLVETKSGLIVTTRRVPVGR